MKNRPEGWTLKQEVKRLRSQMLVHSCIYYRLDDSLITDHEWMQRAQTLAKLQEVIKAKAGHCSIGWYDDAFEDWDGSSGFQLPLADPWVVSKARHLLELREKRDGTKQSNV